MEYDFKSIEKHILKKLSKKPYFKPYVDNLKESIFLAYTPTSKNIIPLDILSRFFRMQGYNVLFPKLGYIEDGLSVFVKDEVLDIRREVFMLFSKKGLLFHSNQKWFLNISPFYEGISNLDISDENNFKEYMEEESGAIVRFEVFDFEETLEIFLPSPQLIYGITYIVLDKTHPNALTFVDKYESIEVLDFIEKHSSSNELSFTGAYAIHPITKKKLPILIGEGIEHLARAAIPAHDETDFVCAKKYDLDIIPVMDCDVSLNPYLGEMPIINSDLLNGLEQNEAREKIISHLEQNNIGMYNAFYGKKLIQIGIDDVNGIEVTINDVIYNISMFDMLNAVAFIYYFSNSEENYIFDDYSKKDLGKYLPADYFIYNGFDEFLITYIVIQVLESEKIIQSKMVSLRQITTFQIRKTEWIDLNHLLAIDCGDISFCGDFLNSIWKMYHIFLLDDVIELDDILSCLIKKTVKNYEQLCFKEIIYDCKCFVDKVLELNMLSYNQGLTFLKLISPVIPLMTEEIYETVYNGEDILNYLDFPV